MLQLWLCASHIVFTALAAATIARAGVIVCASVCALAAMYNPSRLEYLTTTSTAANVSKRNFLFRCRGWMTACANTKLLFAPHALNHASSKCVAGMEC
jgi:hypothetical protein